MAYSPEGKVVLDPFALTQIQAREFLEKTSPGPYNAGPRYEQLERYEAFYRGEQYDHQKYDWWGMPPELWETQSPQVVQQPPGFEVIAQGLSTRQKKPSVETNTAKAVVRRLTGLLFGEQRLPQVMVEQDPQTEALLEELRKQMRFWPKWRSARNLGGAVGSVALTVHMRDSKMALEVHNSKHCKVLWRDRRTWTPAAMLKTWSVLREEPVIDQKTNKVVGVREVEWIYRRIITEIEDVVYKPVRAEGAKPEDFEWTPDPALYTKHDLGFFPGVWVQNHEDEEELDGDADCEGAWKMIDVLDRLLSQMNKGVLQTCDPTPWTATDPKQSGAAAGSPVPLGSGSALELGKDGKAGFLEITGAGIEAAGKLADKLDKRIQALTRCIMVDPAEVGGSAVSSLAIKLMFEPMLTCADELRDQYGGAIVRTLEIAVAIVRKFTSAEPIPLPDGPDGEKRVGVFDLRLPPRLVMGADGKVTPVPQELGPGGQISIQWGPYFSKTPQEEGLDIQNAVAAKAGELVDRETASKHVAGPIFQVRDVASMQQNVEREQAEMLAQAEASAEAGVTGESMRALTGEGTGRGPRPEAEA